MNLNAFFHPRRLVPTIAASAALWAIAPGAAFATDYCVQDAGCAGSGGTPKASVDAALTAADADAAPDRVLVGPGFYLSPVGGYHASSNPVQLIGAGAGATTLTGPVDTGTVLALQNHASSVSDLTIAIPYGATGAPKYGLKMQAGRSARRIAITVDPNMPIWTIGADLETGALLEDSSVTLPPGTAGTWGAKAIQANVRGTTITAMAGLVVGGSNNQFDRDQITAVGGPGIESAAISATARAPC